MGTNLDPNHIQFLSAGTRVICVVGIPTVRIFGKTHSHSALLPSLPVRIFGKPVSRGAKITSSRQLHMLVHELKYTHTSLEFIKLQPIYHPQSSAPSLVNATTTVMVSDVRYRGGAVRCGRESGGARLPMM